MALTPGDLTRTCPYCGASPAPFALLGNGNDATNGRDGTQRNWYRAGCPACGGVIVLETSFPHDNFVAAYPQAVTDSTNVAHLPPEVQTHWDEAVAVAKVGANRSAVVGCGRALEAAAISHGIEKGTLQQRIKKMLDQDLITTQFGQAMDYVRVIRNTGAHAGDDVSTDTAEGTLNFTLQALRLLFEVPGELERLTERPPELDEEGDAGEDED